MLFYVFCILHVIMHTLLLIHDSIIIFFRGAGDCSFVYLLQIYSKEDKCDMFIIEC